MAEPVRKLSAIEADWDKRAVQSAIDAARQVVGDGINGRSLISSLSEIEWGWICAASIFAWIKTKSQQAVEEGSCAELPIRAMTGRDPAPWEAGAVETILPELGGIDSLDWSRPVGEWAKHDIVAFSWRVYQLVNMALAARDAGAADKIVRRLSQPEIEREVSAKNGGPLFSRGELDDDIPF